jgi:hypothetical protein
MAHFGETLSYEQSKMVFTADPVWGAPTGLNSEQNIS